MNTITLLTGDKPSGKRFPKPSGKIPFPYLHDYKVLEINSLQDIKDIIETNRGNPNNYFIRGVPHTFEANGKYRRKIVNTTDTLQKWICLDIDGIPKDKSVRDFLISELPFVDETTGILLDYSSKEGVYGKDVDYRDKYYVHAYMLCNRGFISAEWKQRLKDFPFIDLALFNPVQAHYFAEPSFDEGYQTGLTERTVLYSGESIKAENIPLPTQIIKHTTTGQKGAKVESLEETYKAKIIEGGRHVGLFSFFMTVIAKGGDQEYWINRYWNDPNRSTDHDTVDAIYAVMQEAKDYLYGKLTNNLEPNFPVITLDEENLREYFNRNKGFEIGKNYFIKSGQATYKTEALKEIPKTITVNGNKRAARVLLIGHRVELIRDTCNKLSLEIYSELPEGTNLWEVDRLGITFDSLWRLLGAEYDFVSLDESEQIINEILTTTRIFEQDNDYPDKRIQLPSQVRATLGKQISQAKTVIASDADLGNLTQWFIEDWKTDNFTIFDNQYKSQKGRTIWLMPSLDAMLEQIHSDIREGKRVYINHDTKKGSITLHDELTGWYDTPSMRRAQSREQAKGILIHADNKNKTTKAIANNPNEVLPELMDKGLQWLDTSPTFETGISIGKKEDMEHRFHSAYGYWTWNEYTATTLRQAILRVRNADNYYVYMPKKFGEADDVSGILDAIEQDNPEPRQVDRTEELKRYALKQKQLSVKNRVLHFQYLCEEIGATLKRVDGNSCESYLWNEAQRVSTEKQIKQILKADDVNTEKEYEELGFSEEEIYMRWKYEARKAFDIEPEELTSALIKRWGFGRVHKKHQLRQFLQQPYEQILDEEYEIEKLCDSKQSPYLHEALTLLFDDFGINPEEHAKTGKFRLLFEEHIEPETLDYLCEDDRLTWLKYVLGYHNIVLSDVKKLKAEPLRLYAKLAGLLTYSVTHYGENDKRLNRKETNIDDLIDEYFETDIYNRYLQSDEIPTGKAKLNKATKKILEQRIIARADDLSEVEINFYRARHKHLVLRDYEPEYTNHFGKKSPDYDSHIEQNISGEKIHESLDDIETQAIAGLM